MGGSPSNDFFATASSILATDLTFLDLLAAPTPDNNLEVAHCLITCLTALDVIVTLVAYASTHRV